MFSMYWLRCNAEPLIWRNFEWYRLEKVLCGFLYAVDCSDELESGWVLVSGVSETAEVLASDVEDGFVGWGFSI